MNNNERKKQADKFLYEMGLWDELTVYGEPHIIGSYRMDLMAWNDLDIDIDITNSHMSAEKLYKLSDFIFKTFKPLWYEAKQETADDGKNVWFHGFEATVSGSLWNFDIWFFDGKTVSDAESFCAAVIKKLDADPAYRERIITIKNNLIENGQYGFGKYTGMDVYTAVLEKNVRSFDEFLRLKTL